MTNRRNDALRLADILRSISRIAELLDDGYEAFSGSWKSQSAVMRELEIIGEAAGMLSASLCARHPEVEWAKMRGFASFAKHEYWRVNPQLLWKAVEEMPTLRTKVSGIVPRSE